MYWMRWQIQSALHEQSTLALGLARNGCIKPLMFLRNILKQGLSTSGFVQLVHVSTFGICQLIYTLVIYKYFSSKPLTK